MSSPEENLPQAPSPSFCEEKHVHFIKGLLEKEDSFELVVMEHLKVCVCVSTHI